MYNALKYVMFVRTEEKRDGTIISQHIPVIFPHAIMHSDLANRIREQGYEESMHERYSEIRYKPVSAGFIGLPDMKCFGESESLSLKSRDQDTQIIQQWPQDKGMIE